MMAQSSAPPSRALFWAMSAVTLAALVGASEADATPRFYDAVVVEAEGRSGAEPPPSPLPPVEVCSLPFESGPCRGYFASFYFDGATSTCRRFTYSGCGGNANRFRTVKACEAACSPSSPQQSTPATQPAPTTPVADADSVEAAASAEVPSADSGERTEDCRTPRCPSGCFVVNDGATDCPKCECSEEARRRLCALPPSRGHCRALLTRWHFDAASGDCARFRFGGCDGNGNNFASRDQCLKACAPLSKAHAAADTHQWGLLFSRLRRYFSKFSELATSQKRKAWE